VVSHDRYFLERVTDSTWALLGDGQISMLPRGVEEYLERREASLRRPLAESPVPAEASRSVATSAQQRDARKTVSRVERQLSKVAERETRLHAELAEHAADYERLASLGAELREVVAQREALEEEWLEAATLLE
jgi:ABC transport system ATP-binding/permease protein